MKRKTKNSSPSADWFPTIVTRLDDSSDHSNYELYNHAIRNNLKSILSHHFDHSATEKLDPKAFHAALPLTFMSPSKATVPCKMSSMALLKSRPNAFKFFLDLTSLWLCPDKTLNVLMVYATDFYIPHFSDDLYSLYEVIIQIDKTPDLEQILLNLPSVQSAVRLGLQQDFHARRLLESRGLTPDGKIAIIQERIASIMNRWPTLFTQECTSDMQHFLVVSDESFKAMRTCPHLSRIIYTLFLFRKMLREAIKKEPEKRHILLKVFRNQLDDEDKKTVLGIMIAINFLQEKEIFDERNILNAVQEHVPEASLVPHSFISFKKDNENGYILYFEIEKLSLDHFATDEIVRLQQFLPISLKDCIEHFMHPIYMPKNEEEIMRNIWVLSNQIKYLHDLPQVITSFDRQTHKELVFSIIMVAVVEPGVMSLDDTFKGAKTDFLYLLERSKTIGYLRKKYVKEALVFTAKVDKYQFLRSDLSIDLNKARVAVITEIKRVLGDIRDYNGGMITKENELLTALSAKLTEVTFKPIDLESFFYSLSPDIMRTVLDPDLLKGLFLLMLESMKEGPLKNETYSMMTKSEIDYVLVILKLSDLTIQEKISQELKHFDSSETKIASASLVAYGTPHLGYIFISNEPDKQRQFCNTIQRTLIMNDANAGLKTE